MGRSLPAVAPQRVAKDVRALLQLLAWVLRDLGTALKVVDETRRQLILSLKSNMIHFSSSSVR